MKSGPLLNSGLSAVVSRMGHLDSLVIADAGLPIPRETERIDLALTRGIPSFIETLKTVLEELRVEKMMVAEEIRSRNPAQLRQIEELARSYGESNGIKVELIFVSHEELKAKCSKSAAVVRTGECTPYSNVILFSGVVF